MYTCIMRAKKFPVFASRPGAVISLVKFYITLGARAEIRPGYTRSPGIIHKSDAVAAESCRDLLYAREPTPTPRRSV